MNVGRQQIHHSSTFVQFVIIDFAVRTRHVNRDTTQCGLHFSVK